MHNITRQALNSTIESITGEPEEHPDTMRFFMKLSAASCFLRILNLEVGK